MKKKFGFAIPIVIIVVAFVLLSSSVVVTYPNEYTVIKQFGKIESIRKTPGLSLKIPFIQTEEKIQN